MAVIHKKNRPAIDIIQDSYNRPEGIWSYLGDTESRTILQQAIRSVGRLDIVGHPTFSFLGTAFVVGPDLLLTSGITNVCETEGDRHVFRDGQSAFVDFKRELTPSQPARVEIQEILLVEPRLGVDLVRAKLPADLQPLTLAVTEPEDLAQRDVALIGYPASDSRNDHDVLNRIFRGVFDVKRLLPGKVLGHEWYGDRCIAVTHDCTSTGGCGGAPLVDVKSGEVIGIQFAGKYLEKNYAISTWELASDPIFADLGVRFSGEKSTTRSSIPVNADEDANLRSMVDVSLDDAPERADAHDEPPPIHALEAIVLSTARPAHLVDGGRVISSGKWERTLLQYEPQLNLAVRAVGKLRIKGSPSGADWAGTAFMVGERLAMAASYAVDIFANGRGEDVKLRDGMEAAIDFGEALGLSDSDAMTRVKSVRFIHPLFSVALLELEAPPPGVSILDLAAQLPAEISGRAVAVISFAQRDPRRPQDWQDKVYGGNWERLFVQPGLVVQMGQTPGNTEAPALIHDCSTISGSGGGPVVDLGTGYVVGIHTHALWMEGGYAQPSWELARDPNVWRHSIHFRPDPRPKWLDKWSQPRSSPAAQPVPKPAPQAGPQHWTVDEIPIKWELDEPKQLESLLVLAVDSRDALFMAENVGVALGKVNRNQAPKYLWRELLKEAATAGLLRPLIETIADDRSFAGIRPKLLIFLGSQPSDGND